MTLSMFPNILIHPTPRQQFLYTGVITILSIFNPPLTKWWRYIWVAPYTFFYYICISARHAQVICSSYFISVKKLEEKVKQSIPKPNFSYLPWKMATTNRSRPPMPVCKPPPLPPDTEEAIIEVIEVIRSRSPSPCARILQNASPVKSK